MATVQENQLAELKIHTAEMKLQTAELKKHSAALASQALTLNAHTPLLEDILKTLKVIAIGAVLPNAPPQYTGPDTINDLVVGTGRPLQGMDPDGDNLTWSIDPANAAQASVSAGGVLTAKIPLPANTAITVILDDGKTP